MQYQKHVKINDKSTIKNLSILRGYLTQTEGKATDAHTIHYALEKTLEVIDYAKERKPKPITKKTTT